LDGGDGGTEESEAERCAECATHDRQAEHAG
jgi:hypothetical protein